MMNQIRSILSASVLVAATALINSPINADSPDAIPTRLAVGQMESVETPFDHLFRSSSSHVQLVVDEFAFGDEESSLAFAEEVDDQAQSDEQTADESNQESAERPADEQSRRRDRIMAGIGALKKPASEIRIHTATGGEAPENRAELFSQHRPTISIGALGIASADPDRYTICFRHRPLYYEQRNLERCGQSCGCLQNGVSAALFLWNTAILPCQIGRQHCDCLVTAGGDCKTCQSYPIDCKLLPIDGHGLVVQAAALAGFTFLLL